MSTSRFIADMHMRHKNIFKYRPVFESTQHNDLYFKYILERICTKRDTMYFLGDILFDEYYIPFIKELPGKKVLIMGNHCSEYVHITKLIQAFDDIHAILKYKEFWLTHAPIHSDELRGKINIHGHVHTESINDKRYLNVSADSSFSKFFPRTLEEVRTAFVKINSENAFYDGIESGKELEVLSQNEISKECYFKALEDSRKTTIYF